MIALAVRKPDTLTLPEMVDVVMAHSWSVARDNDAQERALRRVTQRVALESMMILGGDAAASAEARGYILERLVQLARDLKTRKDADPITTAHYRQAARDIEHYLDDSVANAPKSASSPWGKGPRSRFPMPPGPPLGG
jgi:hypothetical protein